MSLKRNARNRVMARIRRAPAMATCHARCAFPDVANGTTRPAPSIFVCLDVAGM